MYLLLVMSRKQYLIVLPKFVIALPWYKERDDAPLIGTWGHIWSAVPSLGALTQ